MLDFCSRTPNKSYSNDNDQALHDFFLLDQNIMVIIFSPQVMHL
jgi:hypothetical protein